MRQVLLRLKNQGHTQDTAAMELGITRSKLRRLLDAYGVQWGRPVALRTLYRGKWRTLREIAHLSRQPLLVVRNRYDRGDRGDRLGRPRPHERGGDRMDGRRKEAG